MWGVIGVAVCVLIVCGMIVASVVDARNERMQIAEVRARIRDRRVKELEQELFPEWYVVEVDESLPVGSPGRHAPDCECVRCREMRDGFQRKGW
jgi:hypothetical protein